MEVLSSNATKGLPIHSCHLMFEEQEHLEEGRRARLTPYLSGKTLKCTHNPQILANFADIREDVECPLRPLAPNPLDSVEPIDD